MTCRSLSYLCALVQPCTFAAILVAMTTVAVAVPLAPIPRGDIAIRLKPVATGLGAPDYGISPPGDSERLFVIEQNGLLLVLDNDSLLPTPALDMRSRVSPPFNPANANDERGFLGLAFHPDFGNSNAAGFRTLYTYSTEPLGSPTYPAPAGAIQNFQMVVNEWKMSASGSQCGRPRFKARDLFARQEC